jgi:hypothetical protein
VNGRGMEREKGGRVWSFGRGLRQRGMRSEFYMYEWDMGVGRLMD